MCFSLGRLEQLHLSHNLAREASTEKMGTTILGERGQSLPACLPTAMFDDCLSTGHSQEAICLSFSGLHVRSPISKHASCCWVANGAGQRLGSHFAELIHPHSCRQLIFL